MEQNTMHFLLGDCSKKVQSNVLLFYVAEIQTCRPNPCNNGGKCVVVDQDHFLCDCKGTGYSGTICQSGIIITPDYPKLKMNSSSGPFLLKAYPSESLAVSLKTNADLNIEPRSSLQIVHPNTKVNFVLKTKTPGIKVISYSVHGPDSKHFTVPDDSVIFVSPQVPHAKSVYARMLLAKGELPLGCHMYKSKACSCDAIFFSTIQWTGTSPSTTGIVQLARPNDVPIPLSLIGLDLEDTSVSRNKLIESWHKISTKSKEEISSINHGNGKCSDVKTGQSELLELIDSSSVPSSFLTMLSGRTPGWFDISVSEDNTAFDIRNILVNLAVKALKIPQFSKFPFSQSSSIAYQCPNIQYRLYAALDELTLSTDEGCFATDICTTSVFIHFSKPNMKKLKSLKVFQDMKDKGLDITVASVGFVKDGETSNEVNGLVWNGNKLSKLKPFEYNLWLRGEMQWVIQIPRSMKVSIHVQGQAFAYSSNIEKVSVMRFFLKLKSYIFSCSVDF